MRHFRITVIAALIACLFSAASSTQLVAASDVKASITVEQVSPSSYGTWTIISGENVKFSSTGADVNKLKYSLSLTSFGPTVITAAPPAGMSATITVFRRDELLLKNALPQYSFNLLPNDDYRFLIQYAPARPSSLGVTSEPAGIKFRVRGPNGKNFTGVTPADFKNLPGGRYTVTFGRTGNCTLPAAQSIVLKPDQRNVINTTISCNETAEEPVFRSSVTKRSIRQLIEDREAKRATQKK